MNPVEERVARANNMVRASAKPGQDMQHKLGETLADLRAWAAHMDVSFSLSSELSRTAYIHDRVKVSLAPALEDEP